MNRNMTPAVARAHQDLGARIARLRTKKGLSQAQFASRVNISLRRLEGIEKGEAQIAFDLLSKIADSLEITLYRLLKGIA